MRLLAFADWLSQRNIGLVAAGVAFYAMLALFPALTAFVALWGIVADPAVVMAYLAEFRELVPDDVARIVTEQLVDLASARTDVLGWAGGLSTALALWSARSGVGALMTGLNAVHGLTGRSSLRHYLAALALTLALTLLALVSVAAAVVAPVILALVPLGPAAAVLAEISRWSLGVGAIVMAIGLLYRYGPNFPGPRPGWITPGVLLAVGLWVVASVGLSLYVAHFPSFNRLYGTLGAVVVLLFWLYLASLSILLGAALDAWRAEGRGA